METQKLQIELMPLTEADVPEVFEIEKDTFTLPWSLRLFYDEFKHPGRAFYLAAKTGTSGNGKKTAGYAGFWLIDKEVNIVNLAVHKDFRRQKIGERLLAGLLSLALQKGAEIATLEVREGSTPALKLYEKFGFKLIAIRKAYYSDNGENACVLWLNPITLKEEE